MAFGPVLWIDGWITLDAAGFGGADLWLAHHKWLDVRANKRLPLSSRTAHACLPHQPEAAMSTANPKNTEKSASSREPADADEPAFEAVMSELEGLVERLEGGDLSLEESLDAFERGVALSRAADQRVAAAERRVEQLISGPSGDTVAPLEDA